VLSMRCVQGNSRRDVCSSLIPHVNSFHNIPLLKISLTTLLLSFPFTLPKSQSPKIINESIMDSPPPNNPDNNHNSRAKEDPLRPRASGENEDGEMDMINLQDNGLVVVMFLMSVAGWMLRERCIC